MKEHRNPSRHLAAIVMLGTLGLFALCTPTYPQEKSESDQPASAEAKASEPAAPKAESAAVAPAAETKPAEPEKIPLNLKDAPIDQIVNFLTKNTGKVVFKSKDVKPNITVSCPEPVTPQRAVELICDALRLEGVAVVDRDGVIYLVPEKDVGKMRILVIEPTVKAPAGGLVQKVIQPQVADVAEIAKMLTPLLPEGSKLVADPRSGRIIITAPAEVLVNLEKVIEQIDVVEIRETQVRIFRLEHAVAAEVAPILQAILANTPGGAAGPTEGPKQPGGPPSGAGGEEVTVVPYKAANWIVVRATREKLDAAEQLIKQLDKVKPPELELQVILLTHAQARDLAPQLTDLFRRRPREKAISDTVEIAADERSNALIILSSPSNFELVKKIVATLDTEEARQRETRSYPLTYADAEDAAEQLNDLYSRLYESSSPWGTYRSRDYSTTARFVAERRTNTLIVVAAPVEFEQIEKLIEQLDQPISQAEVSPRIYHIQNIDAKELTEVLNDVFGVEEDTGTGGYPWYSRYNVTETEVGRLYGKVRFVHEPGTNSIVVITNNKENFPIIEELIKRLDISTSEYANTLVYELENADAADVANQLNQLFAPPGSARPAEETEEERARSYMSWLFGSTKEEERPISNLIGQVRVVPDTRINALIITTSVQNFGVLRELIEKLDVESPKVMIEVQLVEITRTRESRIGTRLSSDSTLFQSSDFNQMLLGALGFTWEQVTTDTVLSADVNLALLIQLLQRNYDARVLSQPSLVVNNNQSAEIFVGSDVPFIKQSISEPGTTARSDTYDYKEVGTKLVIKPHVNKRDKVVTSVEITASQRRPGEVVFGAEVMDRRYYKTELAVESGQTVVAGGILRQDELEIVHRVPILGYIPVLNLLFSKRDKVVTTEELIAFITPTVLRERAADEEVTQKKREEVKGLENLMPELHEPGKDADQ